MNSTKLISVLFLATAFLFAKQCFAISAAEMSSLIGYTVLTSTNASGELEGADYDKLVKLDNGMIFEFKTYDYFYSYHPDVIVFAKTIALPNDKNFTSYKLVIEDEDEVFDVIRVK
jgi:hypothetical protein